MSPGSEPCWLLLAFQLPTQPGYLRVKLWRRLQDVGAISVRNAVYVLPHSEAALEDFEWILREVIAGGGSGAIFAAALVEGMTDEELRAQFDAARDVDYAALEEELGALAASVARRRGRRESPQLANDLLRARRRLADIESIDFFNASGRLAVHALLRELEERSFATAEESAQMNASDGAQMVHGAVWVTRAHVKVDRMASAWLVQRRIDPEARFRFVTDRNYRPAAGEVRFDMYEAEYTHDAGRCTFEVLLDRVEPRDAALQAIGEIVHDLDLKDHRYERAETAGVKRLLDGIVAQCERDEDRLELGARLFDDLYLSFGGRRIERNSR
jgi:hypothetical protein